MARFGFLWGFALLYHQVSYRLALSSPLDAGVTLAALATLLWPGSVAALTTLAGLYLLSTVQHLPAVYNHAYFASLVSLALLLAGMVAWWRSRRVREHPLDDAFSAAFQPAGRLCLLLLYFLSGFHKLNHDFLTAGVSCGSVMFDALSNRLGLPGGWAPLGVAAIGFTLAVELGVPVLLRISRTRTIGVIMALLFHVAMAAAGYPRFSAAGVALLTLFLPGETPAWYLAMRTRVIVAAVLLLGAAAGPSVAEPFFLAVQLGLTAMVLLLALRALRHRAAAPAGVRPPGWTLGWAPMLAAVIVLLSGATPYLGLGTDRALAMYSNLRTEGGATNHLLVPAGAQLFPFQRDLVLIRESNVPALQRAAAMGMVMPYQELRAVLTDASGSGAASPSVVYVRWGERHETADARRDSALALPVPWIARKLLRFRMVEAAGRRACGV